MPGGYTGRILFIDLSSSEHHIKELDINDGMKFIGGKGLGAKLLWDLSKDGTDPLDPENPLIFVTGPLNALAVPTSGRFCVVTRSPLTGIFNDSHCGGHFGPEIKRAGYDAVVVTGKASEPSYVYVKDDEIIFEDASDIWGKTTFDTTDVLRKKHDDPSLRIASIGPAGENLVRYAMINIDTCDQKERGGQAGRGGTGAVMGSKGLKALIVKGTGSVDVYNRRELKAAAREAFRITREDPLVSSRTFYGTPMWVNPMNEYGLLPTKNFQRSHFNGADSISGESMRRDVVKRDVSCSGCPIRCGKFSVIDEGEHAGTRLEGPEYELLALLGSNCMIDDLGTVCRASYLVDELGLDGISTGNVIAWAMECFERGIFTREKLDGLELCFGHSDPYLEIIKKIAYRDGIGDLLAEGVKVASETVGEGSSEFAIHSKGMEFPGYEPRGSPGMGLAYATSDRGACHMRAWTIKSELSMEQRFHGHGRAELVKKIQDERAASFSLVMCSFAPLGTELLAKLYSAATGNSLGEGDYIKAGERIWNLIRMYNLRQGISREDDSLPGRMYEPLESGPSAGNVFTRELFDGMLDEYYILRGWDEKGVPTMEKLNSLDLGFTLG